MTTVRAASPTVPAARRLMSLDAYRGFIMVAMLSNGLGILEIAARFPTNPVWAFLAHQVDHAPWRGCTFWDLIQPSFMFMMGVAIPYSYARSREKGKSDGRIFARVLLRGASLFLLGFVGVLTIHRLLLLKPPFPVPLLPTHILVQIGLMYLIAYGFVRARPRTQLVTAVSILVAWTIAFILWPVPEPGLFAHWRRDTNLGISWDRWLVGLSASDWLDQVHVFGLTSLNFVPGVSTILAGMAAGSFLRGPSPTPGKKAARLLWIGVSCLVVGWLLDRTLVPMVKLIWTASFAVYSTGWTLGFLAFFYWVIDVRERRGWALPLVVLGSNSIAMFLLYVTVDWYITKGWTTVIGPGLFESTYGPMWSALATLLTLWAVAAFLYWRRIFIRL